MPYRLSYGYDPTFLLLIPALIIAAIAQIKVKTTFNHYSQIGSRRGVTGAQAAQMILNSVGLYGIRVEQIAGALTDHYAPADQALRLSQAVYGSSSLAALGVAAHEAGHALQHQEDYFPIRIRTAMAPVVKFASYGSWIILLIGLFFSISALVEAGIILYAVLVVFELVTVPVEVNASRRALAQLTNLGILDPDELSGAKAVLSAAAWTYVASLLSAVAQLLRLVLLYGGRRRRR